MKIFSKSLIWKLTLAFMIVALTSAALVAIFIRFTSADRLNQLIVEQFRSNMKTALAEYYAANGSWEGIAENWPRIQPVDPSRSTPLPTPNGGNVLMIPPGGRERRGLFGLADPSGTVLVGIDPFFHAGDLVSAAALSQSTPILVNGEQVGFILTAPLPPRLTPEEALYLQRTNQALIYASLGAILVALIIGVLLTLNLVRPLRALTGAAERIAQGDLEQTVTVGSNDEIGQLGLAFNRMSQEVARVNRLRRQMTADIAHDLRTPLTVIAGYIESMQDGVLQPTPERLALIDTEIQRLQNLVSDLRTLSLAEAGELPLHPQPIAPRDLLERVAALFQHQAAQHGVTLSIQVEKDLPLIPVDESRMVQVFSNFLSNSLRYTPAGGEIVLSAAARGDAVEIDVRDTGAGISADDLPHIFERFYRAEPSRYAENGESGLGLAIARALVEAHGGAILAESQPGQGTLIRTRFKPCGAAPSTAGTR